MAVLLVYDILKFILAYDLLQSASIHPWIFFFLDVITIPGYIIGWRNLLFTMGKKLPSCLNMFTWGIITFICTTAPYLYAIWAGRKGSSSPVYMALIAIVLVLTINMLRKLHRTCTAQTISPDT